MYVSWKEEYIGGLAAHPGTFSRYSGVSEPARERTRLSIAQSPMPVLLCCGWQCQQLTTQFVLAGRCYCPGQAASSVWAPSICTQAFNTTLEFQSPWCHAGDGPGNQLPALAVTRQPFEQELKPVERTGVRTARKLLDSIIAAAISALGYTTRYRGRLASDVKRMEDEISS